ncbi:MAG: hypothetical protein LLF82_000327 [Dehalococcoides mccartyi]|uniref:metallophosphoesterase n=1 Tax=Dehalococcoides mccartyi TaxID=61435 RepID=UPI00242EFD9C|nr:metallophosphoesterase [Dehalococcoides mccartyi]MCF7634861.1 hypothetical protein [Dehalococcoides mccartyi]
MKLPQGETKHSFLTKYEQVKGKKGNSEIMLELQKACGRSTRSSLRDYVSTLRSKPIDELIIRSYTPEAPRPSVPFVRRNEIITTLNIPDREHLKTLAILNDVHAPYYDPVVFDLVCRFLTRLQPDYVILIGDWFDFYQLSRFSQNPKRRLELQNDLYHLFALFSKLRISCPASNIIFVPGNHEDRLRRFKWDKVPELSGLDALKLDQLFKLDKFDIKLGSYDKGLLINGVFMAHHGDRVRKYSGWTAKAMYEKRGGSGICGHSHRGGTYTKRDTFGEYGWWENYCLCSLDPEFDNTPDWHQGFSLVHFIDNRFMVEPIPIVKHAFIYGGEIWRGNKNITQEDIIGTEFNADFQAF